MKKLIKNISLLISSGLLIIFMVLVFVNNNPIEINVPHFTQEELTEQKKAADQAAKAIQRKQKLNRVYSCNVNEDCVIVDKDPCGCTIGPKGVVAVNVNYITDFDEINNKAFGTKSCPEQTSTEKECSPSARAVCQAKRCKITY